MNTFDEYLKNNLSKDLEADKTAKAFYESFISEFPRNMIELIPMDRFLFSPAGYGYDDTFCRQLMYSPLASMGNAFPSIFGIYLKGGTELKLSDTYKDIFGTDVEAAFREVKNDIIELLKAAERLDYDGIEKCKLNSAFKNILIAVYYPSLFLPAPTTTALDAYCDALCYSFPEDASMAYRNHMLVEWMENVPACSEWDCFVLMRFCDWLWRTGKKIDGRIFKQDTSPAIANKITEELDDMDLVGEYKEAVTKVRVNQGEFRDRLLRRYSKCCLCGVSDTQLLTASHIKPWAVSEPEEKLDVNNGFLMCPNHDKLFDKGLISFDDNGNILISETLASPDRIFMNVNDKMHISLTEKNKVFLEYHRSHVFQG